MFSGLMRNWGSAMAAAVVCALPTLAAGSSMLLLHLLAVGTRSTNTKSGPRCSSDRDGHDDTWYTAGFRTSAGLVALETALKEERFPEPAAGPISIPATADTAIRGTLYLAGQPQLTLGRTSSKFKINRKVHDMATVAISGRPPSGSMPCPASRRPRSAGTADGRRS
jgi:hypothetical protein